MRVVVSRALLPIAGYWSLLLSLSLQSDYRTDNWVLPIVVLCGLPLVALASVVLFREAHASGSLLALRDDLTGVGNRRAFVTQSQTLIRKAKPGALGLILLDVDGLKGLNDTCGHQAGDELLEKVAQHIEARGQALEPFVATFDSCSHAHEVRVSFGSSSNRENEKFQELFRRADDSLVQHKRQLYSQGWGSDRRGALKPDTKHQDAEPEEPASAPHSHLKLLG
jgi:GGDEF domain-containing protein